ncbi:uncharacterized protein RAG0_03131 [Rhynchosporium agropyri]|uniref:Uncharacterized protein n=1 Tax=Rhynchosporium agropyri TaxID=914238 RepID=A0A1E1K322_9HELO|nr:uncharacterized protein RAG0_03131 [Rhynchosporium agropyri]
MYVLGIPVDHRLRDVIRGLMKLNDALGSPSTSSNHTERLRQLAQSMRNRGWSVSEDEVDFACYLAEPAVQGGIVVLLTQPPKYQDYNIPTDDIVGECKTLLALRELARLFGVPFDSLSIFDAYPFIVETKLDDDNVDHVESHTTFHEMILEKRPMVVLSAWTSPYKTFEGHETKLLRKKATGAMFFSPTTPYCGLTLSMVNMPHPSYYMNHTPTESCFRQLQILEFAQAYGRWWGTWQEEAWMADLRQRCRARAKFPFDNRCDSSDEAYITKRFTQTLNQLEPLLAKVHYGSSTKTQVEDDLSKDNISELCSNASLILRHIEAEFRDTESVDCAQASAEFLCSWYKRKWCCFDEMPVSPESLPLARRIEFCLVAFAKEMNLTWTPAGDDAYEVDFDAQATAFFHLASGIEDAMDDAPSNIRVQHFATSMDVATVSLMERLAGLGI